MKREGEWIILSASSADTCGAASSAELLQTKGDAHVRAFLTGLSAAVVRVAPVSAHSAGNPPLDGPSARALDRHAHALARRQGDLWKKCGAGRS